MVLDEGASNGSVDVSLVVPKGGDEVRALKLSLTVKGEGGEALEAGFGFSKAVEGAAVCVLSSSRRQNRRYDFDTFSVLRADRLSYF